MKARNLVLSLVLAILSVTAVFAKSYQLTFSAPTKIGTVVFKPGVYHMSLNGTKATFRNDSDREVAAMEVKVQNTDTKNSDTVVDTQKDGTDITVKDIRLGGSKVMVEF